jgi:hypothetical protein
MRLRLALLVGFAVGASFANCGRDPSTLHGTSLYVVAYFTTSGYDIRSLYFSGQTPGGNDLFEATYRPMAPSATKLPSPQKVRVYLGDDLADKQVTVSLYAVDAEGELVQFGASSVKVVKGREVEVSIEMSPFSLESDGGIEDAGEQDSGFFDAGYIDAGRLQDGGMLQCNCDGGCCFPGTPTCFEAVSSAIDAGSGFAPIVFTFNICGPPGGFCSLALCDTGRANACQNGNCSCGKLGAQCPQGTRCSINGAGQNTCVCDFFSQCQGCCNANGTLCASNVALTRVTCGSAGQTCQPCGAIALGPGIDAGTAISCQQGTTGVPSIEQNGVCSTSTTCVGCTGANQCCSEMKCVASAWPRCKKPNANVCIACDLLRTDHCSATGCSCGTAMTPCTAQQYCDRTGTPPKCRNF